MKLNNTSVLDILGISSASICLVHCLIFPVLTILPIGFIHNQWVDLIFCSIAMFVVSKIILSQNPLKVKCILGASVLCVMLGVVLEIIAGKDYLLVLIGGLGMILGHVLNFKSHNK